ncbi:MAG: hypothetical protein HOV80_14835 [Polyangiaceae bacterium]|nr:hypothetical protein [Polyangiaceae bacterium]
MKDLSLTLELCPYGFPIRVELDGGRARVLVDEGNGWDEAGEARVLGGPSVAKRAPSTVRKVG